MTEDLLCEKAEKDCISHHAPQDTYGAGSFACCYVNMRVLLSSTSKLLKGERQKLGGGGGGGGVVMLCYEWEALTLGHNHN